MEEIFDKLGINKRLKAYAYLKLALKVYQSHYFKMKNLYHYLSYKFQTNESNIERNLRYLINKSIQLGDYDLIINIFYQNDCFSTNKRYLKDLDYYLKHSFSN